MKQKRRYQVREWQKIDYVTQRALMKQYDVTIIKDKGSPNILRYTVKQWSKFSDDQKMFLLKTHKEIFLTDWKSKRQKLKLALRFLDIKYLDKGIKIMNRGFKEFDKMMKEFDGGIKSSTGSASGFFGSKNDEFYGVAPKGVTFWGSEPKKRKTKRRHKAKRKKSQGSSDLFYSESKVKIF